MFFCHFFKRLPQITEFRCSGDTAYCLWSYFTKTFRIFQAKYRNCTKYFRLFLGYCGKHGRFGGKAFKNLGGFLIFCDIWGIEERFVLQVVFTGCLCGEFPGRECRDAGRVPLSVQETAKGGEQGTQLGCAQTSVPCPPTQSPARQEEASSPDQALPPGNSPPANGMAARGFQFIKFYRM